MGRAQGETQQGQECISMQTIVTQGGYWNPYEVVSTCFYRCKFCKVTFQMKPLKRFFCDFSWIY